MSTDVFVNEVDLPTLKASLGPEFWDDDLGWFAAKQNKWQFVPGSASGHRIELVTQDEQHDGADPPNVTSPKEVFGGVTLWLSLGDVQATDWDNLPAEVKAWGNTVLIACRRDNYIRWLSAMRTTEKPRAMAKTVTTWLIHHDAARMPEATLQTIRVDPTVSGVKYLFRLGQFV